MPDSAASPRTERSWLRDARARVRLSRRALAEVVHVREETVEAWERGTNTPRLGKRADLANALRMSRVQLDRALGLESAGDGYAQVLNLKPEATGSAAEARDAEARKGPFVDALREVVLTRLSATVDADGDAFDRALKAAFVLGGLTWPD